MNKLNLVLKFEEKLNISKKEAKKRLMLFILFMFGASYLLSMGILGGILLYSEHLRLAICLFFSLSFLSLFIVLLGLYFQVKEDEKGETKSVWTKEYFNEFIKTL